MDINIAIADDQKLFRKGMVALVSTFDEMSLIFEAGNGRELLELCESSEVKPDVILLDLSMPELNGLDTLKILKEKYYYSLSDDKAAFLKHQDLFEENVYLNLPVHIFLGHP
ncbi:response regulator [bacterium]|nr:MAG: response regulator [bacterium]